MPDNLHIQVLSIPENTPQEQTLIHLVDSMQSILDERQLRHLRNAVLLREETQSTYLTKGLAVPHGRTTALESIYVTVGICKNEVSWPDDSQKVRLVFMIGVPTAMVTEYLTTMQKILRWHKNANIGDNGEWLGSEAELLDSLHNTL